MKESSKHWTFDVKSATAHKVNATKSGENQKYLRVIQVHKY